tara:strand:+ start:1739 stop:2080 length:342 start_codon:yes stop_codon:yes gene_type:complete
MKEPKGWESEVVQVIRSKGSEEFLNESGLLKVAVHVCDSLTVASIIHSLFPSGANQKISFADIFEQVSIGVREQNKDDSKGMLSAVRLAESMGIDEMILRLAATMGTEESSAQ